MTKTVAIRVSEDVVARIEAYRETINQQNPAGVEITTSDAARALLLHGLEAVEGAPKKRK